MIVLVLLIGIDVSGSVFDQFDGLSALLKTACPIVVVKVGRLFR